MDLGRQLKAVAEARTKVRTVQKFLFTGAQLLTREVVAAAAAVSCTEVGK